MYIKTKCPYCENVLFHNVRVRVAAPRDCKNENGIILKTIEVRDSITEEGMVRHVLHTIKKYLSDGMEVRELCQILTTCYGIASDYEQVRANPRHFNGGIQPVNFPT